MEIIDNDKPRPENAENPARPEKRRFVLTGLLLLGAGAALIAKQAGYIFPEWIISWQMLLICIGIYIGEKHRFRNAGFFVPVLIGTIFLLRDYYPSFGFREYVWPGVLIVAGLVLILRPRRVRRFGDHRRNRKYGQDKYYTDQDTVFNSNEDYLDNVCIFGATKKNIMSKNFRGGEATSIFGGTELNLMQADISGTIELELTQVFGGCKLILPPHWEIKSELVNIFGGVEDKRPIQNITADQNKVIILRGTSVFGGIEIRSF